MTAQTRQSEVSVNLELLNSGSKSVSFVLEPWCDTVPVPPGASVQILVQGPRDKALEHGALQVELGDDRVTIYTWEGSVARLFSPTGWSSEIDSLPACRDVVAARL